MDKVPLKFAFIICIVLIAQKSTHVQTDVNLHEPIVKQHITLETMGQLIANTAESGGLPTEVSFHECTFGPAAFSKLFHSIPKLEKLDLSASRVRESDFTEWNAAPPIRDLNLSSCYIADYDLKLLQKLDHLESLNLESTMITGKGLAYLPNPSNLRSLNLNSSAFNDNGIPELKRFHHLASLGLAHTNCSARAFYLLGLFPDLEDVEVSIKFDPNGWFRSLIRQPQLKSLPGTTIEELDLDSWNLVDESLNSITSDLPSRKLIISHNKRLSDDCLRSLYHMPLLSELNAQNCSISAESMSTIPQLHKLKKILLDENPLSETGLNQISKLANLQYLSIRQCLAFTSQKRFEQFENMNLAYLNISANPITPMDLAFISKMRNLDTLKLDDIAIGSECFDELATSTSIKYLTFYNSRGLNRHAIENLSRMQQLRIIHFGGSDVTKKDARWLSKQNPQVQIDLNSTYVH